MASQEEREPSADSADVGAAADAGDDALAAFAQHVVTNQIVGYIHGAGAPSVRRCVAARGRGIFVGAHRGGELFRMWYDTRDQSDVLDAPACLAPGPEKDQFAEDVLRTWTRYDAGQVLPVIVVDVGSSLSGLLITPLPGIYMRDRVAFCPGCGATDHTSDCPPYRHA